MTQKQIFQQLDRIEKKIDKLLERAIVIVVKDSEVDKRLLEIFGKEVKK